MRKGSQWKKRVSELKLSAVIIGGVTTFLDATIGLVKSIRELLGLAPHNPAADHGSAHGETVHAEAIHVSVDVDVP